MSRIKEKKQNRYSVCLFVCVYERERVREREREREREIHSQKIDYKKLIIGLF